MPKLPCIFDKTLVLFIIYDKCALFALVSAINGCISIMVLLL